MGPGGAAERCEVRGWEGVGDGDAAHPSRLGGHCCVAGAAPGEPERCAVVPSQCFWGFWT